MLPAIGPLAEAERQDALRGIRLAKIKTANGKVHSVGNLKRLNQIYGTDHPRRSTHLVLSWRTAMRHYPSPPFPGHQQPMPGKTATMNPAPDHGETSYKGSGRLTGKRPSSPAATAGSVARLPSRMLERALMF